MRDQEERSSTAVYSEVVAVGQHNVPPALCVMLLFALGSAHGQDMQGAHACTSLKDDATRLACYDAALRVAKPPASAAEPRASPPALAVQMDAQAKFGDDGRLHTEAKPQLPKHLTAQVRRVVPLAAGLYRLNLDNGQVWETTEADSAMAFKVNDAVTISRGLFNSYRISLAGQMTNVSATRKE